LFLQASLKLDRKVKADPSPTFPAIPATDPVTWSWFRIRACSRPIDT